MTSIQITDQFFAEISRINSRIKKLTDTIENVKMQLYIRDSVKRGRVYEFLNDTFIKNQPSLKNYNVKKLLNQPHEHRLEHFKNELTLLKIEKQVYLAYNLKKNAEIFPKLMTKYTETSCKLLECIEQLVQFDDIPEGEYLEYAKDCPQKHDYIKKLCEMGEIHVKCGT